MDKYLIQINSKYTTNQKEVSKANLVTSNIGGPCKLRIIINIAS